MVSGRPRPPPQKQQQEPKTPPPSSSSTHQSRQGRRSSSTTQESGLAVGLRFHPTDLELVHCYLQTRYSMGGDKFHSDFVHECPEFYGEDEPWVIWRVYGGDDSEKDKTLYFFTHRKRLSRTGKNFNRKVGSGTWSGQLTPREIKDDDGVVVGIKRDFRYEGGCDEEHNEAWLMQEYLIVGDDSDLVLCALRKSPRKTPPTTRDQTRSVGDKKKKKTIVVNQPKAKRQRKEQSYDQQEEEEDGCSTVDEYLNMEQQSSCLDQPKVEEMDLKLDQDHPLLQGLLPYDQFHDDQADCFYPELVFDYEPNLSSTDELLEQSSACYDNNNFSFQVESDKFLDLLLNDCM